MSIEILNVDSKRYVFIDAWRGIAALTVVFFHMVWRTPLETAISSIVPHPLILLIHRGAYGVWIFFILSGFVIAHSVRHVPLSSSGIGNFILRRQLRLDPPYWVMVLLTLGVGFLLPTLDLAPKTPALGAVDVLKNLFYLQRITGAPDIVAVAWTLCIEVQFYLVFIVLLALGTKLQRKPLPAPTIPSSIAVGLVFFLGLLSLIWSYRTEESPWFTSFWFYFAAGALCYWAVREHIKPWVFMVFMACFLLRIASHPSGEMLTGFLMAFLLYGVGRAGHLTDWLGNPVLQYFGRISYSLYLVHHMVVIGVLTLGFKLTGDNALAALCWCAFALTLTIAVAHLLHITIEKPSMQLASRLKKKPSPISNDVSGTELKPLLVGEDLLPRPR